jgi:hypothetical protein
MRTGRHDKANSRFFKFCESAYKFITEYSGMICSRSVNCEARELRVLVICFEVIVSLYFACWCWRLEHEIAEL